MEQTTLVHPSAFCWNPRCSDYGTVNLGNIRRFGRTQAGTQRYQCRTCKGTFVETIGTVFYGRHHRQEMIIECLALLAERNSLAAIHRVKGVKEETVVAWQKGARGAGRPRHLLARHNPGYRYAPTCRARDRQDRGRGGRYLDGPIEDPRAS